MFASEESGNRLWEELVKDNELVEPEVGQDAKEEGPLFDNIMEKWSWSNREPTVDQLNTSLEEIVSEQHRLSFSVAHSTKGLRSLHRRMLVIERYFEALVRKGATQAVATDEGNKEEGNTTHSTRLG